MPPPKTKQGWSLQNMSLHADIWKRFLYCRWMPQALAKGGPSRLALVWLTQQTPTGSVHGCPDRHFPRPAAISKRLRYRGSLRTVPRSLPLARGLPLSALRESASLRAGESTAVAVRRVPSPNLTDSRDGSSPDQGPAVPLVLGRLSDDHGQARGFRLANPAATRSVLLRDRLDVASQAPPGNGECGSATAARRGRS